MNNNINDDTDVINNSETDHLLDNNIRYEVNTEVLKYYRICKLLYLFIIIIYLYTSLFIDTDGYTETFVDITFIYTIIETFSLSVYIYKINNSNNMRMCRIISVILRLFWIIATYFGLNYWLEQTKHSTPFYYITGYIYISNFVYMLCSILISCMLCCININILHTNDTNNINRHTAISIIDDISDIQIFSNLLKFNKYNETICCICLENFNNNDNVRVLKCQHYFHDKCITEWFNQSTKCPMCNQDMNDNI